ncbi:MAG: bifunctional proline dehydrogenase/L-glutamate gamma-semialdehyde dehydrogenase [Oligoflexia bacterium]|nr:bifunctional proline dehydrogenase/L-glutamate gamma-semialdehyde dehydrogenase [Oligoflexia bacterium]MBF0367520.1 bifunctional proline dehydrogenase/L-glutamate gamma-semialdehyde dehydrogenase [Oligoflexia bacterium]
MSQEQYFADEIGLVFTTFKQEEWRLAYSRDYEGAVKSALFTKVVEELLLLKEGHCDNYRGTISIGGLFATIVIYFKEREMSLFSLHLHRELFFLKCQRSLSGKELQQLQAVEGVQLLKKEVERATSIHVLSGEGAPKVAAVDELIFKHKLPRFFSEERFAKVHDKSGAALELLWKEVKGYTPSLLDRINDFVLGEFTKYPKLGEQMMKFLSILPLLTHDESGRETKKLFKEALTFSEKEGFYYHLAKLLKVLLYFIPSPIVRLLLLKSVRLFAKRFIAGENLQEASSALIKLQTSGRNFVLDLLGELPLNDAYAEKYYLKVMELLQEISSPIVMKQSEATEELITLFNKGEQNGAGLSKGSIAIKLTALCANFDSLEFSESYRLIAPRLKQILLLAKELQISIIVDAEHYRYRDALFRIYASVLAEVGEMDTGIVLQAYLKDAYEHLQEIIALAKSRAPKKLQLRLVKGAYWDSETLEARRESYNSYQFLNKEESDIYFREMVHEILKAGEYLQLALASHNFSDHLFAESLREEFFQNAPLIEHQCLHMTCDPLSLSLAKMGYVVRDYVPLGNLISGMGYFVRRLLENSSQVGFLTMLRSGNSNEGAITNIKMITPEERLQRKVAAGKVTHDKGEVTLSSDFGNLPLRRLFLAEEKIVDDLGYGEVALAPRFANSQEEFKNGSWSERPIFYRVTALSGVAHKIYADLDVLSTLHCKLLESTKAQAMLAIISICDGINYTIRQEMQLRSQLTIDTVLAPRGVVMIVAEEIAPLVRQFHSLACALVAGNSVLLHTKEKFSSLYDRLLLHFYAGGVPQEVLLVSTSEHLNDTSPLIQKRVHHQNHLAVAMVASSALLENAIIGLQKVLPSRIYVSSLISDRFKDESKHLLPNSEIVIFKGAVEECCHSKERYHFAMLFSNCQEEIKNFTKSFRAKELFINTVPHRYGEERLSLLNEHLKEFHLFKDCFSSDFTDTDEALLLLPCGSDYQEVCMLKEERVPLAFHWQRLESGLLKWVQNYEEIFSGIHEDEKAVIKSYCEWVQRERILERFVSLQEELCSGCFGYFMASESNPHLKSLLFLLAALTLRVQLAIFAKNESVAKRYREVFALFSPKLNVEILAPSASLWSSALRDRRAEFYIIDGTPSEIRSISSEVPITALHAPKIVSKLDAPAASDFLSYLKKLREERSLTTI